MDTSNEKPVEGSSVSAAQTTSVSSEIKPVGTPPRDASKKSNTLLHKIIGVVILLMAIAYAAYANYPTIIARFPSVKPTPSVTMIAVPTVAPQITAIYTPPYTNLHSWLIKLDKTFYSSKTLPQKGDVGRKDVTGTLYSPLNEGEPICLRSNGESIYLRKKADAGWTRLCDQQISPVAPDDIICQPYNSDTGIPISATFYPVSACSENQAVTSGDYSVHAHVFTGCEVDAKNIGRKCTGIVDIDSPRISVSN
jgi:hypothetical protein